MSWMIKRLESTDPLVLIRAQGNCGNIISLSPTIEKHVNDSRNLDFTNSVVRLYQYYHQCSYLHRLELDDET